jgi:hypothetical protein
MIANLETGSCSTYILKRRPDILGGQAWIYTNDNVAAADLSSGLPLYETRLHLLEAGTVRTC